jgi:ubiquinone biosynthesis protein UbiJ
MTQSTSLNETFETGLRFGREALSAVESELSRLRDEAEKRRRKVSKTAEAEFRRFTETTAALRDDLVERVSDGLQSLLGNLDIATGDDLAKLDRKLNRLAKRIRELESTER